MTAPRRPRSAWLLVGSTPGTLAKVHSAGQRFSRFLAKVRWRRLRALFPAASSSSARSSALSGSMRSPRRAVSVPAALLPGGEQSPRDLQARGAELLLGTESLAVGGEVAHQVRPAEQASFHIEVVVGPPAVRAGDAGELLAEQRLGLAAVATLGDPEDRGAEGERPPKRALAAAQAPAGLIHVDDRGAADLLCKVSVGLCERLARVLHDGVDRAARERGAEQLAKKLCGVAPGDAVAHRECGDRRLEARAEGSRRHPGRQLCPRLGGTSGAAQPVQAVLAHPHGDRGQLADLMALRRGDRDALLLLKRSRA